MGSWRVVLAKAGACFVERLGGMDVGQVSKLSIKIFSLVGGRSLESERKEREGDINELPSPLASAEECWVGLNCKCGLCSMTHRVRGAWYRYLGLGSPIPHCPLSQRIWRKVAGVHPSLPLCV